MNVLNIKKMITEVIDKPAALFIICYIPALKYHTLAYKCIQLLCVQAKHKYGLKELNSNLASLKKNLILF